MLEQSKFFERYHVEEAFKASELQWNTLEKIYDDYQHRTDEFQKVCRELEEFLVTEMLGKCSFHSIRCRVKNPDHLIEKIIRKKGFEHSVKYQKIDVSNYDKIIRDLIGVRILIFSKEEWEHVFDRLINAFPDNRGKDIHMEEIPIAYTRYGDRDVFKGKIKTEHSNRGYRSQHYVVSYKGFFCEIQVRTLSEEVYGEFDHLVKYPYKNDNKFLIRYTNTLAQLLDAVDELISTCFQLGDEGQETVKQYFDLDKYIDWKNISKPAKHGRNLSKGGEQPTDYNNTVMVDAKKYSLDLVLRKGADHE